MKHLSIVGMAVLLAIMLCGGAFAKTDLVQIVTDGCKEELEKYCKEVTPGEGRILACLYSHEDHLSGRCEYALYDAAVQLERAINALAYVANECKDDMSAYCAGVKMGEGRILNCLQKNDKKVSKRCKEARKDVGLE